MGQTFFLLEYGVKLPRPWRQRRHSVQLNSIKSQFRETKPGSSFNETSFSCTSKRYDNSTTPYYPINAPLSVKWLLTGG